MQFRALNLIVRTFRINMEIRFMDYKYLPAGRQVGGQYKYLWLALFIYFFTHFI